MPALEFDPNWTFTVLESYVTIPAFDGGPNGPQKPNEPAQERWMHANLVLDELW